MPDFAATGTSTLEVMRPLKLARPQFGSHAADADEPRSRSGGLPVWWAWLALIAAASTIAVTAGLDALRARPSAAPPEPSNATHSNIGPTSSRNQLALAQANAALQNLRETELRAGLGIGVAQELEQDLATGAEAPAAGIDTPKAEEGAPPPAVAAADATDESSALSQVRRFYRALSKGDGAAAARLVVPEKRGSGPLSAREMSQFYRSLNEPLRLGSVRQLGADLFEATYSYTASRTPCRATAIVRTEAGDARPLIRSIRASC
ncbi:MAG: hypothetical protein KJ901_16150 [Gammaproteobacteria bacterium]|nr:hypothetical protein [Gammaproteobacteria bacterium]